MLEMEDSTAELLLPLSIVLTGEAAVDLGGPRSEFASLLMQSFASSMKTSGIANTTVLPYLYIVLGGVIIDIAQILAYLVIYCLRSVPWQAQLNSGRVST